MSRTLLAARGRLHGAAAVVNASALGAVLLWSGTGPVAKTALDDIPAFAFMFLRPLIAAIILGVAVLATGRSLRVARADVPRLAIAGTCGMGMSQLLYISGLDRTSVSHNVILISTSPLLLAAARWLWTRHAPDSRTLLGLAGGFGGVLLVVGGAAESAEASVTGDLLSLGSAAAWVIATVLPVPLLQRYGAATVTFWMLVCSAAVTLPLGILPAAREIADPPSLGALAALIYAAALGMLLGNSLWQRAVRQTGAARTIVYLYLEPFAAIALAALTLGERLSPVQALGGVLALAGVMLVKKS